MIADNDHDAEPTIFCAKLTPYRSLGRIGFLVLMGVFGTISFAAGLVFWIAGAWPVIGFFGLDVLLIYLAFRLNYRAARAYEEFIVTTSELTVRKVGPHGPVATWTFNPLWTRLDREEHAEFGIERLFLVSRGRRLPVASFLGPDEKADFAAALAAALGEAKRGPTRTVFS
jgi:uncharacterized membrane protein